MTKRFGPTTALDDVSFAVRPGRMTGFVGANGAGKTTAMRVVLGVTLEDAGDVLWRGNPLDLASRSGFGYMPEERGLYPKMPLLEQLVFFARLHGLGDRAGDRLESLSLGNQQRVQVAAALVHDPELLVLDVDGARALVELEPEAAGDLVAAEQRLLARLVRAGAVREFRPVVPTLSEIFREVVR